MKQIKKKEVRDKQFLIAVVNGMYIDRINVDLLLKILRNTSYKILVNMLEQLNIQQNTMSVSDIKMIEAEITKLIGSYDNINTIENPFIKANITDNRKKDLLKTILKVIPKKKQGLRIIYFLMRAPYFPEVRRKKTKHLSNKFVLNISKELIKTKGKVTFDIQEKYKPILIKKLRGTEDKRIIKMMEDVGIDEPYKLNENNFDKLIKKIQSQLNLNLISEEKLKKLKRIFTILEDEITITMTGNKIEINDKTKFKEILKNTSSDKLKTIYKDLGIVQEEISMEDIEPIIKEIRNKMRTKEIIGRFFTLNEISEILGIHAGAVNLDINKIYEHLNKETMKLRKNLNKKRRASEKYEKYGQL